MKNSILKNLEAYSFLPLLMTILFLTFSCHKDDPVLLPNPPIPEVVMEGDYQKTDDNCQADEPSYLLTITRENPVIEDIVDRPVDGIIVIKNLMNSRGSRIIAEGVDNIYQIQSQKTMLKGRLVDISGMLQKSGKKLSINYRLLPYQEPAMHCQSEFLAIR